jgi:hypothetical protein
VPPRSSICYFCLSRVDLLERHLWFKICGAHALPLRLDACTACHADDTVTKCAHCAVEAGELTAPVVQRRTPFVSRIIPFGKKSVTVEQDGANVLISGDTYPLRAALHDKLDASWDGTARKWVAHHAHIDEVERALLKETERVQTERHDARSYSAKKAAETRRIRARRWTPEERAAMQAHYDAWVATGRSVAPRYTWLDAVATHAEATCSECNAMLFLSRVTEPLNCGKCERLYTS